MLAGSPSKASRYLSEMHSSIETASSALRAIPKRRRRNRCACPDHARSSACRSHPIPPLKRARQVPVRFHLAQQEAVHQAAFFQRSAALRRTLRSRAASDRSRCPCVLPHRISVRSPSPQNRRAEAACPCLPAMQRPHARSVRSKDRWALPRARSLRLPHHRSWSHARNAIFIT